MSPCSRREKGGFDGCTQAASARHQKEHRGPDVAGNYTVRFFFALGNILLLDHPCVRGLAAKIRRFTAAHHQPRTRHLKDTPWWDSSIYIFRRVCDITIDVPC